VSETIEIEDTAKDGLSQTRYRFWVNYPRIIFESCCMEKRATKRHKFVIGPRWGRLDRRGNTMLKPTVPDYIQAEALSIACARIVVDTKA
jgi:hypothetical protein